jgi:hypothetical protein
MKRLNLWLLGLSIVVPALMAFSAEGDSRARGEIQFTAGQILGNVRWAPEQRDKVSELRKAHEAQVRPLHEQVKQLELQIRGLNEQFDTNLLALLTSDQIAAARERLREEEHHRFEERRIVEERRLLEAEHRIDEGPRHGSATSRPAGTVEVGHHTEIDRGALREERRIEAERRAEERRHEDHIAGKAIDHPVLSREERQQERERLHQEIERMNHRLNELREEKEVKESGKTPAPTPAK